MSTAFNFVLFHGSTRTARLSDPFRELIVKQLTKRGHNIVVFDAKAVNFPLLEKPSHHYKPDEQKPEYLVDWQKKLNAADGYIILDAEYNHAPSPGMLNLIDHFHHPTYDHKPAVICSYSYAASAGARSTFVLRNVLTEVGAVTIPSLFQAPAIFNLVNKDGEFSDPARQTVFDTVMNEFEWYATALKKAREAGLPKKA